ncbi:hypothetical protein C8F01DRAFT_1244113 [Mycena amicta]|nr:hypothetical protein C8F01DRAFT_1244113 [Mycena amicta]
MQNPVTMANTSVAPRIPNLVVHNLPSRILDSTLSLANTAEPRTMTMYPPAIKRAHMRMHQHPHPSLYRRLYTGLTSASSLASSPLAVITDYF